METEAEAERAVEAARKAQIALDHVLEGLSAEAQREVLSGKDEYGNNWHVTRLGARQSCGSTGNPPGTYPAVEAAGQQADAWVAPGAWVQEWQRRMRCDYTPWTDSAVVAAVDAYFGDGTLPPVDAYFGDRPLPPLPPAWGELGSEGYLPNVATQPEMPTVTVESAKPRRRGGLAALRAAGPIAVRALNLTPDKTGEQVVWSGFALVGEDGLLLLPTEAPSKANRWQVKVREEWNQARLMRVGDCFVPTALTWCD